MEIWDGSRKWQDKTMPDYQYVSMNFVFYQDNNVELRLTLKILQDEIVEFRQRFIYGWVQHPKNEVREKILKAAGVWGKLG